MTCQADDKPKVSVCIVTYNHIKYIEQCILSIVNQETTFPFEVLIGDDASTDGTSDIIEQYASTYPCIRPYVQKQNVGGARNYFTVNKAVKGEYVAYCDGDDYWLPGKLQKQSDFLDENPNFSGVGTHKITLDKESVFKKQPNRVTLYDRNNVLTSLDLPLLSSLMMRNSMRELLNIDPEDFGNDMMVDLDLIVSGPIKILNEYLCVHRTGVGISTNPQKKEWLRNGFQKVFNYAISRGYDPKIVEKKHNYCDLTFALDELAAKNYSGFYELCHSSENDYPFLTTQEKLIIKFRGSPQIALLFLPGVWLPKRLYNALHRFKNILKRS